MFNFRKIYKFLASLKLAVVLLLALAAILATATFYESIYDTKTAQHLVYRSPFFAVFLGVLWINVFCAASIRYPWKKHQVGFVVTHLGILILLAGAMQTMLFGVEGTMALEEGQSGNRITVDQPVFFAGAARQSMKEFPAEFRWNPPREGHPTRVPLDHGLVAVVDRYYHHSRREVNYVAEPGGAMAAVKVRIFNKRVDVSQWLTLSVGSMQMGPATLYFERLRDQAEYDAFLKGKLDPHDRGELQLLIGSQPHKVAVRDLKVGEEQPIPDTPYFVKLDRYLPYAAVNDAKTDLISRSDEPVNPALQVEFSDHKGSSQKWLLFARLSRLNTRLTSQGPELPLRVLYSYEPTAAKSLMLVLGPQQQLAYRLGSGATGSVELKKPTATGWMDLQFEVQEVLDGARESIDFHDVKVSKRQEQEGPPPAIRVTLEGAPKPGPYWLEQGDVIQAGSDDHPLVFGYGLKTVEVGFKDPGLKLKKFQIDYDPGTRNAASYKSIVEVDGQDRTIQMNEPLEQSGFTLFQASFAEKDGRPAISVLSVARDPGLVTKLLGSLLLVMGIAIMFYMKPYMVKNRNKGDGPSVRNNIPPQETAE